jgi:hypothetical protein
LDHGDVSNNDGDECFTDGPASSLLGTIGSGLDKGRGQSGATSADWLAGQEDTDRENQSTAEYCSDHDEDPSTKHEEKPSFPLWIDLCFPE